MIDFQLAVYCGSASTRVRGMSYSVDYSPRGHRRPTSSRWYSSTRPFPGVYETLVEYYLLISIEDLCANGLGSIFPASSCPNQILEISASPEPPTLPSPLIDQLQLLPDSPELFSVSFSRILEQSRVLSPELGELLIQFLVPRIQNEDLET